MKVLDNGFVKFLLGFIKAVVWIFAILVIALIVIQRVFNNSVGLGDYKMFTVATGSMVPDYDVYDVIIVKDVDINTIKVGDDLVYLGNKDDYKDKIITHRVIKINRSGGKYSFITKGIANPEADPTVSEDQVYGIVSYKSTVLSFLSHIMNNSYGLYFLVFVPIAFLIFLEILDKIKEKEDETENKVN